MAINRACLILGIMLFFVGVLLSAHKPLWCDELYGQKVTIEGSSWGKILLGRQDTEGNNFPLYFVIQKAAMSAFHLQLPDDIKKDFLLPTASRKYTFFLQHRAQIIMRIGPNIAMTTAIVFLVRFFWLSDGWVVGLMALLSALSSGMVWWYWVEARLYPLWFLLTVLQSIFLIELLMNNGPSRSGQKRLAIIHWLLAATTSLGFIQVIIVQLVLFVFGRRNLKDHIWAGALPVMAALFWFSGRLPQPLYLLESPLVLIQGNLSFELAGLGLFYLTAFAFRRSWSTQDSRQESLKWKGLLHLAYLSGGLCLAVSLIAFIAYRWPNSHEGLPVYCRHFIFLSALGVVMAPAMFGDLWRRSQGRPFWRKIFLILFIVLLLSQMADSFRYVWIAGGYL